MRNIVESVRRSSLHKYLLIVIVLSVSAAVVNADHGPVPPLHTFAPGTPAKASQVNENFDFLEKRSWDLSTNGLDLYFNGGNVGIGTTTPTEKLHVKDGNLRVSHSSLPVKIQLEDDVDGDIFALLFDRTNDRLNITQSGTPLMSILKGGNVGIGTITPGAKLDVAGDIAISGTQVIDSAGKWVGDPTGLQGPAGTSSWTDAAGQVTTTVNVGIGTTTPSRLLHISGGKLQVTAGSPPNIIVDTTSGAALIEYQPNSGTTQKWSAGGTDNLWKVKDETNSADRFAIDTSGNVGIGTTSPVAKLHLTDTVAGGGFEALTLQNSTGTNGSSAQIKFGITSGSNYKGLIGFKKIGVQGRGDMYFSIEGTTTQTEVNMDADARMVIKFNGNVGIGTASPGARLEVENTSLEGSGIFIVQDSDGTCDADPDVGGLTWSCPSDARMKTNIRDARPVLDDLMKLRVKDFAVKASGEEMTGVIAQEVQEIMPELVREGNDGYLMVSEIKHWKLIKAIQELKAENEALEKKNEGLELAFGETKEELNELKIKLAKFESALEKLETLTAAR